ncbi:ABC transporter ATP-binding protein [archaeon]|nr:ABC transporter ATP-binding protein [archaeon]
MSIEFKSVDFSFHSPRTESVTVLNSFSYAIKAGTTVAIVGPSGCGKSTILKLIAGLIEPCRGSVLVDEKPADQRRQEGVFGLVFQNPDLLPWRTVARNVRLPLEMGGRSPDTQAVQRVLQDVGLGAWISQRPHQLSGGMQQRVALARALVAKPKVLLLDEPFSHLDELLRFELLFHVQNYASSNEATVILVTHDLSEAVIAADVVCILSERPVHSAKSIDVPLSRPRSLASAEQQLYQELVSQVRLCLTQRNS